MATQRPELRARLDTEAGPERLARFLSSSVHLMQVMARACGHDELSGFRASDLTTFRREMADLTGVAFGGVGHTPG